MHIHNVKSLSKIELTDLVILDMSPGHLRLLIVILNIIYLVISNTLVKREQLHEIFRLYTISKDAIPIIGLHATNSSLLKFYLSRFL